MASITFPRSYSRFYCFTLVPLQISPLPPFPPLAGSQTLIFGGPSIDTGCLWLGWFISVTLVMVWCGGCTHVHIMTQCGEASRGGSYRLVLHSPSPYLLSVSLSLSLHPSFLSLTVCGAESFIIWNDFWRNNYLTLNVPRVLMIIYFSLPLSAAESCNNLLKVDMCTEMSVCTPLLSPSCLKTPVKI